MMSFWNTLKKPIMALAPMADVTDAAFRQIIAKYGKPDVMFTEFTSVAGLCSPGREKLLVDFWYTESERPIVAQIFGSNPAQFYEVAKLIKKLGFDGIDINMGCPDRSVEKQGGGASLIKYPLLAQQIIAETKRGAGKLPVSVKTRLGYNTIDLDWIRAVLAAEPAALTVHLRTRKEMSDVPAHWDTMSDIVELAKKISSQHSLSSRRRPGSRPLILGNGDVKDVAEAEEKCAQYGCDGVMIGRGIFGNPWLFSGCQGENLSFREKRGIPNSAKAAGSLGTGPRDGVELKETLRVMLEHTYLFERLFTGIKNFDIMKKHFKAYVSGFDGAKELRIRLMTCKTGDEVATVIEKEFPSLSPVPRH